MYLARYLAGLIPYTVSNNKIVFIPGVLIILSQVTIHISFTKVELVLKNPLRFKDFVIFCSIMLILIYNKTDLQAKETIITVPLLKLPGNRLLKISSEVYIPGDNKNDIFSMKKYMVLIC